jgi:hypothetical protein
VWHRALLAAIREQWIRDCRVRMFTEKIFEVALGISTPWYIQGIAFEPSQRKLNSVSVDMWPAFIRGITDYLPNAQVTFDKFHVFSHASTAISKIRRKEQKTDPDLDQERPVCDSIRSESLLKNLIESAIEFLPRRPATNYVTFFFEKTPPSTHICWLSHINFTVT